MAIHIDVHQCNVETHTITFVNTKIAVIIFFHKHNIHIYYYDLYVSVYRNSKNS